LTATPRRLALPALRECAVLGFFLGIAVLQLGPLVFDLRGQTLIGPDPILEMWAVDWVSQRFLQPGMFAGNIFHPSPHGVFYSDFALGTAVFLVPLRAFVDDPVPLFNLGNLIALTFSGWAFCALLRSLTGNLWAGLVAGVLAAFGSHQMYHVYHLNLLSTGWLAVLLLALFRLLVAPRVGWAVLAGVAYALEAQSSGYYAVITTLLALVFAAVHARQILADRRRLAHFAGAALLGGALLVPYLDAFLTIKRNEGLRRPVGMSMNMAFHPDQDLTSGSYLWSRVLGEEGERLFPGALSLALGALALWRRRRHAGYFGLAAGLLWLMALGPSTRLLGIDLTLPYGFLFALPPFDSMRHPYTFAAIGVLMLAVLGGLGLAASRLLTWRFGGPLCVLVALLEVLGPPPRYRPVPAGVPPVYQLLERLPPGPVLEVDVFEPDTLLWAARHEMPVINGYGAFAPAQHLVLERLIRNHWLSRPPADLDSSRPLRYLLARFPVRYVIVPAGRRPGLLELSDAFERSRHFRHVTVAIDGDRLYEVLPGVPVQPIGEPEE
jgi:hypothetical protein